MSVAVMRWNSDTEDAVLLDGAFNLAEYNFFQRGRCAAGLPLSPPTFAPTLTLRALPTPAA